MNTIPPNNPSSTVDANIIYPINIFKHLYLYSKTITKVSTVRIQTITNAFTRPNPKFVTALCSSDSVNT